MRRLMYVRLVLYAITLIIVSACQTPPSQPVSSPLATRVAIPTHSSPLPPGRASLAGQVVSTTTNTPLSKAPVRLAKVYREGSEAIFVLDAAFSPGGVTNEEGYFIIEDVEPGEYVLVVGNPEGLYEIISDSSGQAKVWQLIPDQLTNVGVLHVKIFP